MNPGTLDVPATDGGLQTARRISVLMALEMLKDGALEIEGQFVHGSNHTFLARVTLNDVVVHAVYKPRAGERPLWDFPEGTLCEREVAAWWVSDALGWRLVPPTILRDGPMGEGMIQLYIPHDPEDHYLVMDDPDEIAVDRIVAFDIVINNADRKSGHVLRSDDGALWAIDHGVAFHTEPKLRTVVWERAGRPLPASVVADLTSLFETIKPRSGPSPASLDAFIASHEISAISHRIERLLSDGRYPSPSDDRREFPWPPV